MPLAAKVTRSIQVKVVLADDDPDIAAKTAVHAGAYEGSTASTPGPEYFVDYPTSYSQLLL
jgi:hypothetical protein